MPRDPSPEVLEALRAAAVKRNVPITLLEAIAFAESSFDPSVVGPTTSDGQHAQGLMQLMPSVQARYGVTNPFDATQSADAAAQLLNALGKATKWDVDAMLAAYNLGPVKYARFKAAGKELPKSVRDYVRKVQAARYYYEGQADVPSGTHVQQLDTAIAELLKLNPTWPPVVLVARSWQPYYAAHKDDSDARALLDPQLKLHWQGYRLAFERAPLTAATTPAPYKLAPDVWQAANEAIDKAKSVAKEVGTFVARAAEGGAFGMLALLAAFLFGLSSRRR